jgi:hypothetical protein
MPDENQPTELAMEIMRGPLTALLWRVDADEFTTLQLIDVIELDEDAERAYAEALALWPHNERLGKMIVHGQVIPQLLRESGVVEWAGFAHGEEDDYAVPAWWRQVEPVTP